MNTIQVPVKRGELHHRIVAGFLSLLLPGLGQVFKGDIMAGCIFFVGIGFCAVLVVTLPLIPIVWIANVGHALVATTAITPGK